MSDKPFEGIGAVYFDLDDTLCGYWIAASKALRETLELHGPKHIHVDQMVDHWAAAFRELISVIRQKPWYKTYLNQSDLGRTEQMRMTLARAELDDEAMAAAMSRHYMEARDRHLELFPDAIAVLDKLKLQFPLGLITNGPADIQRMEISTLAIESYFDNIFIEGEMGFGKPEPEVFRRAAAAVSLPPEKLLFVGNSYLHDILPAIEAGWKTAWIKRASDVPPSSGKSAPEERPTDKPAPDAEIGSLSELLELL